MKTKRIIARHPLGLMLELIGLVSVAIILSTPVALAQVGGGRAWGAPDDIPVPADYDGDGKSTEELESSCARPSRHGVDREVSPEETAQRRKSFMAYLARVNNPG